MDGLDSSVDGEQGRRLDAAKSELAARWYVWLLDAGMARCDQRGEPLTASQRFTLLTAGQLALGSWRPLMPARGDGGG